MNKKIVTLMAILSAFAVSLTACSKNNEKGNDTAQTQSEQTIVETDYHFKFSSALINDESGKPFEYSYDLPYASLSFANSGTIFNKDLAKLSFAFTVLSDSKEKINDIYTKFGFDHIVNSSDYDQVETKDTIQYTIGHKSIDGVDVIALSMNAMNYKLPWASNLTIGKTGNHAGFQSGANIVLAGLNSYLASYSNVNTRKIWINGYSRSAAVGDIVAYTLVDNGLVKEDNLYAYLFETPQGVDVSNTKEYKSIFNIINSGDVVTYVAPTIYGFKRVGIDVDLYSETMDSTLKEFNENLVLSPFTASEDKYSNESELINYLIGKLATEVTSDNPEEESRDLSTRDNYVDYYQEHIAYLIGLVMSLKAETIMAIQDSFEKLTLLGKMALMGEDGFYDFLKPILDAQEETYDDESLRLSLNRLLDIIQIAPEILLLVMDETTQESLMRCIQLHSPEVVFPLLLALN